MEGYLTKRGSFFKTWRTRWFDLSGNKLIYYKNQSKIAESFEEFQGE